LPLEVLSQNVAPVDNVLLHALRTEFCCLQVQPLVGSGFGYCATASANKTGDVDAALPPTAGGVAALSQYNVIPRTTIINEKCRLPVVYG